MGDERQVLKGTRGGLSHTGGCLGIRNVFLDMKDIPHREDKGMD